MTDVTPEIEMAAKLAEMAMSVTHNARFAWIRLYENAEKASCLSELGLCLRAYRLEDDAAHFLNVACIKKLGLAKSAKSV